MPITVAEKYDSRQSTTGSNAQVTLTYIASGSDDDLAVKAAVESFAPETYDSLPRQSVQIEPISEEYWDASVRYADSSSPSSSSGGTPDPGSNEYTYSFDTMGGTQHITQSLDTVGSYADSSIPSAPDFHGAIGVSNTNGNAEVQGVDNGGIILGEGFTPQKQRPYAGKLVTPPATGEGIIGTGFYLLDSRYGETEFVLFDANETLAVEVCDDGE